MSDDEPTFSADTGGETYSAIRTVLGSTNRTARWHLTDEVDVLTALGRSNFDLRLVETTGHPVAELTVKCFLGTVNLIVPPGTLVVLDGNSFLASASCEVAPGPPSSLPRIEVTATTLFGRVRIISSEDAADTHQLTAAESATPDLTSTPAASAEPVEPVEQTSATLDDEAATPMEPSGQDAAAAEAQMIDDLIAASGSTPAASSADDEPLAS